MSIPSCASWAAQVGVGVAALPNWAAWLLQYKFLVAVSLFVFEYPRRKIESCMSVTLAIPLVAAGVG